MRTGCLEPHQLLGNKNQQNKKSQECPDLLFAAQSRSGLRITENTSGDQGFGGGEFKVGVDGIEFARFVAGEAGGMSEELLHVADDAVSAIGTQAVQASRFQRWHRQCRIREDLPDS